MSLMNSTKNYTTRENGNERSTDVQINDTDEMTRIPEID